MEINHTQKDDYSEFHTPTRKNKIYRMKMKKGLIIIVWISGMIPLIAQNGKVSLSLEESCRLGIHQNVTVRNTELERQKTQYRSKELQGKLYPQLEAYSIFNYNYAIPKLVVPGEIFGQTGPIPVEIGTTFDLSGGFKATQLLYHQSYFTSLQLARKMTALEELNLQQKKRRSSSKYRSYIIYARLPMNRLRS